MLTGDTLEFLVNGDFWNTCSIIGFCGTDAKCPPLSFNVHDEKNDSFSFSSAMTQAIAKGFFRPGDTLVLDNAEITPKDKTLNLWTGCGTNMGFQ